MKQRLDEASKYRIAPRQTLKELQSLADNLKAKGIPPNCTTYESLLSAYARLPDVGPVILSLLSEMEAQHIIPSRTFCNKALRFIAPSGNAKLQAQILNVMASSGLEFTNRTFQSILLCTQHNLELERALDTLDEMRLRKVPLNLAGLQSVIKLCSIFNEPEIAEEIMCKFEQNANETAANPFIHLSILRCAALNDCYSVVKSRWNAVIKHQFRPDDGLCRHILRVASRFGDTELARQVIAHIGEQGLSYSESHFVPLLDAFIANEDINSAFYMLSIMRQAGITPRRELSQSIVRFLRSNPHRLPQAREILSNMGTQGVPVDIVAFNALINALVATKHTDDGLALYKSASSFKVTPDIDTVNAVIDACIHGSLPEYGYHVYETMVEQGILKPTARTLSKMIVLACEAPDIEKAFGYLSTMKRRGMIPHRGCGVVLATVLSKAKDDRFSDVVALFQEYGHDLGLVDGFWDTSFPDDTTAGRSN